ncbi:hypothetical protein V9K67_24680 [Paraflavisolibacter sp. H34]|uniref:hypothetical protein n=1 Tax=Huijunlia imazamoxiresistens TaxID=3127457 RepID=UPI00301989B5
MMVNADQYKKLLYEHEVLWARLEIRDHYLNKVVQEVYENIGQVLSLVKVQLALLSQTGGAGVTATEPCVLVSQVIKDFRAMCRNFYPEKELISRQGLLQALENELNLADPGPGQAPNVFGVTGNGRPLPAGTELIVFRMLQEILFRVRKEHRLLPLDLQVRYEAEAVTFVLAYAGSPVEWTGGGQPAGTGCSSPRLNLWERAAVVGAQLEAGECAGGTMSIKLTVPYN